MKQQQLPVTGQTAMPTWLVGIAVFVYLGVLALLVFLPGATLLERLRWLDSGVCAQLPTHSFYPGGERLPLCARNTGIYLGFIVTLATLYATGRGRVQRLPPWPVIVTLVSGIIMLAIDGGNSLLLDLGLPHLYHPHNLLRLAAGLLTGLAMAALILPVTNRLFWCEYNEQRSIASWRALALCLPALIICFFAVISQSGVVLYPIALLSTSGLVMALSSVNLIIIVALSRRDQVFSHYRELLPYFGLALACASGELIALAHLKVLLLHALGG